MSSAVTGKVATFWRVKLHVRIAISQLLPPGSMRFARTSPRRAARAACSNCVLASVGCGCDRILLAGTMRRLNARRPQVAPTWTRLETAALEGEWNQESA
eukprot:2930874-Pyramimonas_sp.AAC.1